MLPTVTQKSRGGKRRSSAHTVEAGGASPAPSTRLRRDLGGIATGTALPAPDSLHASRSRRAPPRRVVIATRLPIRSRQEGERDSPSGARWIGADRAGRAICPAIGAHFELAAQRRQLSMLVITKSPNKAVHMNHRGGTEVTR